jgi:methylated-DNA-[protein]-cysteine S-methyltransferase
MKSMTEGVYIEPLGLYLLVEQSGGKISHIYLSNEPPAEESELARQIADYLRGQALCPHVVLVQSGLTDFQKRVYGVVRGIERGKTMTYGEVAACAGKPGAARAVGRALSVNPFLIIVPCHRVVARNGLGGFACGIETKEKLLALENEKRESTVLGSNPSKDIKR